MQQVYVCLWTSGAYYPMQQVFYMTYVSSYYCYDCVSSSTRIRTRSARTSLAANHRVSEAIRRSKALKVTLNLCRAC